jgi:hypothetical protein
MALQQINWSQIDTRNVPSGSQTDLGTISGSLHSIYADHIYISGQLLSNSDELNQWSASIKEAIETTGSNLTVKGNLLVKGTTTAINSTTVSIGDNVIELNGTEAGFGGLLVKDPTAPNTISGSLLWDTANDKWIGGPLGDEEGFIQETEFTNFSSSVSTTIDEIGIWRETGSFYATTHDLQVTGSMRIKGDLFVEGKTTLIQKLDPNVESLVVSGAMNIVQNQISSQVIAASLKIQGLGELADISKFAIIDCGDGFF